MYSVRQATIEDNFAWDRYVLGHAKATPYHLFAWGKAISHAYNHSQRYVLAEAGGVIVGVLPLIEMNRPILRNKLVSLPFCDLGGPLADTDEIAHGLKEFVAKSFEQESDMAEYREPAMSRDKSDTELTGKKVRMLLTLPDSSAQLLDGFKSKLRSQINKAKKNGLSYSLSHPYENTDLLTEFYRVFSINMRLLGSPVHSKQWFEKIALAFEKRCIVSIVYLGRTVVAGGMILLSDSKASIPWASTNPEYNRLSPNMLLYWSLLEYCCDHGYSEFDFGRSTFGEGTYKFKAQWGAAPQLLHWNLGMDNEAGPESGARGGVRRLRNLVEAVWRKLPLKMTTTFGPRIRKYISL